MATRKSTPQKKKPSATKSARRGKKAPRVEAGSRGLSPQDGVPERRPSRIERLEETIAIDGGSVIGAYRDPIGGHWQVLALLPLERVRPTPFQRDLSDAHVQRLAGVLERLDRFLDPIVAVRVASGEYWTPNGLHRLEAMRRLGAKAVAALVVPELSVAFHILALNTEKAHNLKEKSLEVIRMARSLGELEPRSESAFAMEFEEPSYLSLGLTYEARARFSGSVYRPVLKRIERFLDLPLPDAIAAREATRDLLLELDDAVLEAVSRLEARGLKSPYLKTFVVARINPLRFSKEEAPELERTLKKMRDAARRFDAQKISGDQLAASGGPPEE